MTSELPLDHKPIYLGKDDIIKCLKNRWDDLIKAMEEALSNYSAGNVTQPIRSVVSVSSNNRLLTMPAYDSAKKALVTKLVTVYPQNKFLGLPSVQGTVLLFNADNGTLNAILDAIVITKMRTAAASAVATKFLAKPDSKVLAILGAGEQARSHFEVLNYLYKFEKVNIWNINKESGKKLVQEILQSGVEATFYDAVKDAVYNADIVVTATMSQNPILKKEWLKNGAHINAVGAPFPSWQEISEELMLSAVIYVDSQEGALEESGDIIKSKAKIYAEIGEVLLGTKRARPSEITIFKSLGMAVEDALAAQLIYDIYEKSLQV